MMTPFSKMHGLGNDFVVFNALEQAPELSPERIRALADRHFGVGCDQVLLVEHSEREDCLFRYRIFNADGDEVEQCGNGARCFARFVTDQGLTTEHNIPVDTLGGRIVLHVLDDGQVRVNMGSPHFAPSDIPFAAEAPALEYPLDIGNETLHIAALSMGNPHAVTWVDDVSTAEIDRLGPLVESHPRFPQRVNAGFTQLIDPHNIHLRVYERGAGETLACGTGACAAAVAGMHQGKLDSPVRVQLPGGALIIEWLGDNEPVYMTGPANTVFHGRIDLESL